MIPVATPADRQKIKRATYRNNALYRIFLEMAECGPLDGGCKAFALALKRLIGGDLYVVEGTNGQTSLRQAQHVVVRAHEYFWDVEGPRTAPNLLRRLRRLEGIEGGALRPFRLGDVSYAVEDRALIEAVYQHLLKATR